MLNLIQTDVVNVRYFSLARYALLEGLRILAANGKKRILIPSYICRDLLAPINILGFDINWYHLKPDLTSILPPQLWPKADIVIAINYFGFPQDLSPFNIYASENSAIIIEDNAHGFLSRDINGRLLGTRTDLGIFSFRKTFRMSDGAALVVNERRFEERLAPQLSFSGKGYNSSEAIRLTLRRVPVVGSWLVNIATNAMRLFRLVRYGAAIKPTDLTSESELPTSAPPWIGLPEALDAIDAVIETDRRRTAYMKMALMAATLNIEPIFLDLPANCVPYGFPFRASGDTSEKMKELAAMEGYGIMSWPDLPSAVKAHAPAHYLDVRLVNFLW